MGYIKFLSVVVAAFLIQFRPAFADMNVNKVYQPIVISQTLSLSPHRICHDGLFIYFIDTEQCLKSKIPGFDCQKNYHIAPIRSAEQIHLPGDKSKKVTRFYHIDLTYRYQEVDKDNNIMLIDENRTVSACEDRNIFVTENVTTRRQVQTKEEEMIVASLIDQAAKNKDESYLLLNTPIGNINRPEVLTLDDMDKSENELQNAIFKTPFCNEAHIGADQIWQMSGSYTGSGVQSLKPAALQIISRPLYVKRSVWVVNPDTKKMELRYEFTCERTWDI